MAQTKRSEGEVLDGRYRLGKRLGRGGFGDVWRAEELLPDGTTLREVALKLLHGSVASSPDWSAEARIIASLRHPALVTVYAAGLLQADRPIPFVAMELLLGDNLSDLINDEQNESGTIPWRRVLAWAREAAAALDVIHRAGVVHLDLKPANLFLADGAIKVLDFGIARQGKGRAPSIRGAALPAPAPEDEMATAAFLVEHSKMESETPDATRPGSTSHAVVGTPGFMAPEVFEEGEASPATDAYALAACIVQLTTGSLPQAVAGKPPTVDPSTTVGAWFAEVQAATVRGQIRDLQSEHPELPRALVALLDRWLALDPVQRGVERGSMHSALDAVWNCPHGVAANPYRGLAAHTIHDEGVLFGREPDITRIARELVDHHLVVLYGDGAIGLSSLAVAGVLPDLARQFADDKHDWMLCEVPFAEVDAHHTPDDVLTRSLAKVLGGDPDTSGGATTSSVDALFELANTSDIGFAILIEDLERLVTRSTDGSMNSAPSGQHADPANPTDHTESPSKGGTTRLEQLLGRVSEGASGVRLIATLDAEHVTTISELETMGPILQPWLRFIGAIQPSAVADLVRGPARLAGVSVDGVDLIVDELQAELAEDGTRLPLASLALARWWDEGARDYDSWRSGGGLIGRVCRHAEEVVEQLDSPDCGLAANVLLRTVSVDGTSAPVSEAALVEASEDRARLRHVIAALLDARILMRDEGHLRLAHTALAEKWPRLHDLRLHDIDRLTFLEDLRNAAGKWTHGGRARKHLWPPDMLRQLDRRRAEVAGELGEIERAFVATSQRQRQIGWLLRGALVLTVLFLVGLANYINMHVERRHAAQVARLREAQKIAALERMVTASRRTHDPYHRVALLSGAIAAGSPDPLLSVDLLEAGRDLPPAKFLSLSKVDSPDFPWGTRWLVARTDTQLVLYDFEPPAGAEWSPIHYRFRPHAASLTDVVPLPFDTSVVTRDQRGEVKVWRLRENGQIGLVATAPEHCVLGPLHVAEKAATIACTTSKGVARWDLQRPDVMIPSGFDGRVLDVSADGRWVVSARLRDLMLWDQAAGHQQTLSLDDPPKVAEVSERDAIFALVRGGTLEIRQLSDASVLLQRDVLVREPTALRWGDSGIDLAVCDYEGAAEWHYLRHGRRATEDAPLPPHPMPCDARPHAWPKPLYDSTDFKQISTTDVGPRVLERGWELEDGTLITHDLVMFQPSDARLRRRLQLTAPPAKDPSPNASTAAAVVDGDGMVWQVGDHMRRHDADGQEEARWKGHLLARCESGRVLAWRREGHDAKAKAWEIFGARVDILLGRINRFPGNVLGSDPGCQRVFFQALDGRLLMAKVDTRGDAEPVVAPGGGFVLDGFVYDARPSFAPTPGMWLAMSGGALVRVDGATGGVTAYGHATPRASAMVDGPDPGDLLFADDRGLVLRSAGAGQDRVVLEPVPERTWEDIALSPDETTLWLSWAHGVTVVDVQRGDVLGELDVPSHDRFTRWDDEGSLLLWPYSYKGQPRGQIIPVGLRSVAEVGSAASNVRAMLQDNKRAVILLDD